MYCVAASTSMIFYVDHSDLTIAADYGVYIHVDVELPDIDEENDLMVSISTEKGQYEQKAHFDKTTIQLFRDGDHLHAGAIPLSSLYDEDYSTIREKDDRLLVLLYSNGSLVKSLSIPIYDFSRSDEDEDGKAESEETRTEVVTTDEIMENLNRQPGWHNFKKRMEEMAVRCKIGGLRYMLGLENISPNLHTIIIGNPGTGKTTCIPYMVSLYHSLGCLGSSKVHETRLSKIVAAGLNEYESTMGIIKDAAGGTVVFENAHELYKAEIKSFDPEPKVVRALIDALDDKETYPNWMLVLTGELSGIETLLANYPELQKHFTEPIYMEDFKPEELFRIMGSLCEERQLILSDDARKKLEMYILHKYNHRTTGFQNAWMVQKLIDEQIVPTMFKRLNGIFLPTLEDVVHVEAEDIPVVNSNPDAGMEELEALVGLGKIKSKMKDYLNAVRLAGRRMERGLPTNMPRLHMAFLGNPGTGKTTVAEIIGRVFASWGILSGGRVIRTEKSQMVGQYIGETEFKMRNLLARAHGNILFIDEAYQLVEGGEKDYGRIVMNSLLTELGKDNQDMVVILAGYTAPMKQLLESNGGIESRFPNVFNFEDYTTDELVEIGKLMIRRQGFTLTAGAEANLRTIIEEESEKPSPRFGNGRFVSNLLQNEILATLGARTSSLEHPTPEQLSTILPEDVVIGKSQKDVVFDDVAIDAALARLDALAGLGNVKKAVHNFVTSARYLHSIGEPYVGKGLLSWRFIGRSGTGKSTVAEIMAAILKGMRLIANSHVTQIKGERIFNVSEADCDTVLREAVKKACNGLIFIDVDEPKFGDSRFNYGRSVEQIMLKVKELTVEAGGECALILAELEAPNGSVAEQLVDAGIYEFDHTLVFKDFTPDELFDVLCICLNKYEITFSPSAEKHFREYLKALSSSVYANARTMKLMSRAIYQQVILREAGLVRRPSRHQVQLADIEAVKWDPKRGKIGF